MTLLLNEMDETSKAYEEAWKSILAAFETDFRLLTEIKENISMDVIETPGYTHQFLMTSGSLPQSILGIWAHATTDVRLTIDIYYNKEEQIFKAFPHLRYTHKGGGSNGCGIANFGESKTAVVYNLQEKTVELEVSNHELYQLLGTLHRMGSELEEDMNTEEQAVYERLSATRVKRTGRLTNEKIGDIILCLHYYIEKLDAWNKENNGYMYSYNEVEEALQKARNTVQELRNTN